MLSDKDLEELKLELEKTSIMLSDKDLEELKLELEKTSIGLNNFAFTYTDPDTTAIHPGQMCFGSLPGLMPVKEGNLVAFLENCLYKCKDTVASYQEYLQWLMNDSYWSPAFLDKDPKKLMECGSISYNVDLPMKFIVIAAKHVRLIREYPLIVDKWMLLKDEISRELAVFFAAHMLLFGHNQAFSWTKGAGPHVPVDFESFSVNSIRAMVSHDYTVLVKEKMQDGESIRNQNNVFIQSEKNKKEFVNLPLVTSTTKVKLFGAETKIAGLPIEELGSSVRNIAKKYKLLYSK